jgi:hypothetical protein
MIEGSVEALHFLTRDLSVVDEVRYGSRRGLALPFLFLTNSGARTEASTAEIMNDKLALPES